MWDVHPALDDRRSGRERRRRIATADARHSERRGRDRRLVDVRQHLVRNGFERGWLCFISGLERHRLAPIPDAWDRANAEGLLGFLAVARHRNGA